MAGLLDTFKAPDSAQQALPMALQPSNRLAPLRGRQLESPGHARGRRDVLGAGPPIPLLSSTLLLGQDVGPVADVQGPDALGPFELVRRDAQQVHAQNIHVEAQVCSAQIRVMTLPRASAKTSRAGSRLRTRKPSEGKS